VVAVDLAGDLAAAHNLLSDHAACYPPAVAGTALEPLFPDQLGEDFLARLLPGATPSGGDVGRGTVGPAAAVRRGDMPVAPALAVLVEIGRRWAHVRHDYLFPLFAEHPRLIMESGAAGLVTLAEYAPRELA
jgi:hypothetical protein